jgi:hypothetical protein
MHPAPLGIRCDATMLESLTQTEYCMHIFRFERHLGMCTVTAFRMTSMALTYTHELLVRGSSIVAVHWLLTDVLANSRLRSWNPPSGVTMTFFLCANLSTGTSGAPTRTCHTAILRQGKKKESLARSMTGSSDWCFITGTTAMWYQCGTRFKRQVEPFYFPSSPEPLTK